MTEFICCLCMFEEDVPDLTDDEKAEREVLTVINGQMVCLAHQGYAEGGQHSAMLRTMRAESR